MKTAYKYDKETKIYIGERECQLDPLETEKAGRSIYLLPANCTLKAPLSKKDGYNVVWNEEDWEYVEIPKGPEPEVLEPTLEEVKAEKIAELKRARDAKELEPVLYDNHYYDFDIKSYNRIMAAVDVLDRAEIEYQQNQNNLPEEENTRPHIVWTTADNDNITLTADGLHGIIQTAAMRSNELHIQYRILKEAVNNMDSISSIKATTWESYKDYN